MDFTLELDRKLVECLTKMVDCMCQMQITEAHLELTDKGANLSNIDNCNVVAVNGFIGFSSFLKYQFTARSERSTLGVDLKKFLKILKSIGKSHRIEISHQDNSDREEPIEIRIQNATGNKTSSFFLEVLNLESNTLIGSNMSKNLEEYPIKLSLPVADFKEIVEETKLYKKEVAHIKYCSDLLSFQIPQIGSKIEYRISNSLEEINDQEMVDQDIAGKVASSGLLVEKLVQMSKCSSLVKNVELFLNQSPYHPIYFNFPIGNVGYLLFAISPRVE